MWAVVDSTLPPNCKVNGLKNSGMVAPESGGILRGKKYQVEWPEKKKKKMKKRRREMHDCQIIPFVSERSIIVINAM